MFISVTQLNTDVFSLCFSAGKKYKTQEDFLREHRGLHGLSKYRQYFSEHAKPGNTVRSRVADNGVVAGERGRVVRVGELLGVLRVKVVWERRGRDGEWWLCDDVDLVE